MGMEGGGKEGGKVGRWLEKEEGGRRREFRLVKGVRAGLATLAPTRP